MKKNLSAVIFDVDGVLLDSLTPHLQICENKSREYGLGFSIPTPENFKKLVRQGVKISPMNLFFQAVGFPREFAEEAFGEYKETFARDYALKPFPQIGDMLSKLKSEELRLGIVTSNVKANIDSALGFHMKFFDPTCIFTKENMESDSKSGTILLAANRLNADISETLYVGDQPSDWLAAKDADVNFLGVTYGWGISDQDTEFPVVNNVMDIAKFVLNFIN